MSDYSLNCSNCDELVMKSVSGEIKVRAKVLLVRDECTYAVCKGCNSEIPIPMKMDADMAKSISTARNEPRLYLRR